LYLGQENRLTKIGAFVWKGDENANGGHWLTNQPMMSKPKGLRGLGVSDLDK
jgi:hypothetical protein